MHPTGKEVFQVLRNNFNNRCSEFYFHQYLMTHANKITPYYPKICVTRNTDGTTTLGVRTRQGFTYVDFKKHEYQKHSTWETDGPILKNQILMTINFTRDTHNPHGPPCSIFGFQSGQLVCVDQHSKNIINVYNEDKGQSSVHKRASVKLVAILPQFFTEFIVLFEDSTAMRYTLKVTNSIDFMKKIKKFDQKISFSPKLNKFKPEMKTKTKNKYFEFNCFLDEEKHEFNFFHAINKLPVEKNPNAYYKFNHKDISDFVVRSHASFEKTILRHSTNKEDNMILALTSRDGYLVLYQLNAMKPLLSYKAQSGGFNGLCFSENCELIALSGPDEHITVLDLYTMTTLRCIEGHKFLMSRAIFQNIQMDDGRQGEDQENEGEVIKEDRQSRWMRIIGGGMDGMLSFWEFRTDIFGIARVEIEESELPLRLNTGNITKSHIIKPIHLEHLCDAIGWVEIFDDMLLVSKYDGQVEHLQSRSLTRPG